jgi:2-polyprenyl-3-methyl-5-hydroxy-6-metoxy-1,4-benzoquinol methylase/Zn ribbon nucleic-acid-binding protein
MRFSEQDIRPEKLMKAVKLFTDYDIKFLLKNKKKFVKVTCPACQSNKKIFFLKKNGFRYSSCVNCLTYYMNPRPTVKILDYFYKNSKSYRFWNKYIFPASEKVRRKKIFKPRVMECIKFCKKYNFKKPSLVDVGAGFGTFCDLVKKTGFFSRVLAIEPSEEGYLNCKKNKINSINDVIENVKFKRKDKFNIITNFEVIEHLFSPRDFLLNIKKNLKSKGLVMFSCPNGDGFDVKFLGKKSNTIDHEHLNYFNTNSIKILLKKSGYKTLEVFTPGKLDISIIESYVKNKNIIIEDPFYQKVFNKKNQKLQNNFQDFIASNNLSSSMFVVAKKKR